MASARGREQLTRRAARTAERDIGGVFFCRGVGIGRGRVDKPELVVGAAQGDGGRPESGTGRWPPPTGAGAGGAGVVGGGGWRSAWGPPLTSTVLFTARATAGCGGPRVAGPAANI